MGPFTAIDGDGDGYFYSKMINGRAADSHYHTQFFAHGFTRYLDSKEENSQVGGMMSLSSQMQSGLLDGHGKIYLTNGRIFVGEFK